MNKRLTPPVLLAIWCSACCLPAANAAIWTAGSGSYSNSSNWDIPAVPCFELLPVANVVDIAASGSTVSQDVAVCSVQSLTLGAGTSFSLLADTQYTADAGELSGYIIGNGGNLTITGAAFAGTDPRVSAASGSVVDIDAPALTSTTPANSSVTVLSAAGSGSQVLLRSLASLNAAFNSSFGSTQFRQVVASDGGVVDLSGLGELFGPADDEDYFQFVVSDAATINLDALHTVTAGGFVRLDVSQNATLNLPALQSTQDLQILAATGGKIFADAAPWTYSFTGRPNSSTTIIRASGAQSLAALAGISTFNSAFNSSFGSAQFNVVEAFSDGVVDLSGVIDITGPADDEDYLAFEVSDTGSILFDAVEAITAGGYVRFLANTGATLTLPSLVSTQAAQMLAQGGGSIIANGDPWTYAFTSRPNSSSTIIRAFGANSLVDLSTMTTLSSAFNSSFGSSQFNIVTAYDEGVVDLSGVVSTTGPADDEDYLAFEVADTGSILLDSLETVTAGGYVRLFADAGATLSLPSLITTQAAQILADNGGQVIANGEPWDYAFTSRPNSSSTIIRAIGVGSLADLSTMTTLNSAFNSSFGSAQFNLITASDGGVIDLSGVTAISGPADDEDFLAIDVADTGTILLDSLATITTGGYVRVFANTGAALALPALTSTQGAQILAQAGGQVIANGEPWAYNFTSRPNSNSTIIRARGADSLANLSSMRTLNSAFNSSFGSAQNNAVIVEDGATLDLSGVMTITGPNDSEDSLTFDVSGGGLLALGPLDNVSGGGRVALASTGVGSTLAFPHGLDAANKISITSATGTQVIVNGDFSFAHTNEARFNLESASVAIVSVESTWLEVGGFNIGATVPTDPNFAFAQLIIGSAGQSTTTMLVDIVANGNGSELCGFGREALYLYGLDDGPTPDGLRILNGSTLNLGGLDLYATVGGVLMHINPMLTPGVPMPFDEGFIDLGNAFDIDGDGVADSVDNCVIVANADQADTDSDGYGNACDADINGDVIVNAVDLAELRRVFFSTPGADNWNPNADFNNDDQVNVIDLGIMIQAFFAPPGPSCPVPVAASQTKRRERGEQADVQTLIKELFGTVQKR